MKKVEEPMKIALINENSQASKNAIIYKALKDVADEKGHESFNYGMTGKEGESRLTYVQNGLLASILLGTKAVDFVVTGCGTGVGAMLACNSFPGVVCGIAIEPTDAYLFSQINGGNALSIPYAKGFGWGAELNLTLIFERLFAEPMGGGYPKERVVPEQRNARILNEVKAVVYKPLIQVLKEIDQDFLKETIATENFTEYFIANAEPGEVRDYILAPLA
ncbi:MULTISPECIES: RpiB/LacA/LacB family sugar-phosphate isomerase [unclassified Cryobacterium]|uniref:RpiB/LacA/LacB family sugar-phosphate isomerase n=2 Tax=unclassified Cryobacterium TaxID=2649013 RepID=UPI002AB5B4D1|nr:MULTISPECIES: RpiB/LacA/LacB family sugar-phosphate isomerase [unclassified Cryobacterium]MDY7526406.1 RpiB/LacA/LacB family sugar-phosphate isomerase [Cryobacterium sp. 10C2]MEB0003271.1 RpiB/LacA/LacB family sugar-phosphate isomerase [Cryobacterium sp. RTC2.1]MEB0202837.1 RpiB/LacA/LacB family sugar-phosphate isomerase [Cryobacterium sp. 5I3]MEB0291614.1 RpiB/LacA/LacB family sugar-phosphate isomerase [Cryobacterium sp. 10C2]WPX13863.1 RpiB/LacA/LacB family sugar-phosphate isomerase [Cryo